MKPFDPEDPKTWPIPGYGVSLWRRNGTALLNEVGNGWFDGFDKGLRMADHSHKTREWDVTK